VACRRILFFPFFLYFLRAATHDLADDGRKTQGGGSGIRWVAKKRMEGEVVSFSFEVKDVTRREEILYIRAAAVCVVRTYNIRIYPSL
jgi:hypothetical protein